MIRWDDREGTYWCDPCTDEDLSALAKLEKLPNGRWRRPGWRGLGDVVASATKFVGIAPCGSCEERRRWLNRKFPLTNAGSPAILPPSEEPDGQSRTD